jgi:hypothetical protein
VVARARDSVPARTPRRPVHAHPIWQGRRIGAWANVTEKHVGREPLNSGPRLSVRAKELRAERQAGEVDGPDPHTSERGAGDQPDSWAPRVGT